MTLYYLKLALISIRGNPGHTAIMVGAIALGVGVCMSIVTVNYLMGKDPIPHKSGVLFNVQLDNWSPNGPFQSPNEPPDQLTWRDASALKEAGKAFRETKNAVYSVVIQPDDPDTRPFQASARGTHTDFFAMFDTPFRFGGGWSEEAEGDFDSEAVAVLSREINDRLFGGIDSVGRDLLIGGATYRVVGVLDEWKPVPKFYDVTNNPYGDIEDIFIPFGLVISQQLQRQGNTNCWKPTAMSLRALLGSECIWIQYWAELRNEVERDEYMNFLNDYVLGQKESGRFERPLNNQLSNVREWLDKQRIVQPEARMLLAVAVMFLGVCLLNTIGLLLSKFLGKAPEVGVRRALGASRRTLFYQYLVETALIGIAGGVIGLALTAFGLQAMIALFGSDAENLLQLDLTLVLFAVLLSIGASIAAGLYPTWRACNISPALQLKSQ